MTHTIDQFGFEAISEIPVKENDYGALVEAFLASDARVITRTYEDSRKASNVAGAIRKAAAKVAGADVTVVNDGGVIYISKNDGCYVSYPKDGCCDSVCTKD